MSKTCIFKNDIRHAKKTHHETRTFFWPPPCKISWFRFPDALLVRNPPKILRSRSSRRPFCPIPSIYPPKLKITNIKNVVRHAKKWDIRKSWISSFGTLFWDLTLPIGRLDRPESESGLQTAWILSKSTQIGPTGVKSGGVNVNAPGGGGQGVLTAVNVYWLKKRSRVDHASRIL